MVAGLPSSVADAVFRRPPGRRPDEYATIPPVRPTSRSIWSSGIWADSVADPESVNERVVGSVKVRVIEVSGSKRAGEGPVLHRFMEMLKRLFWLAAPTVVSRSVGIAMTSVIVCPGIDTSAKPTPVRGPGDV